MRALGELLAAVGIFLALHLATLALVGRAMGARPRRVVFGYGPALTTFRVGASEVRLGLVPLGGYVQFWLSSDDPPAPAGEPLFDRLPALRRVATLLSAGVVGVLLASALTATPPWTLLATTARDVVRGALAPTTVGAGLVAAVVAAARDRPFPAFLGAVIGCVASFNLLPLPGLNGGDALIALIGPKERPIWLSVLGLLALFAGAIAWAIALVTFLRR